MIKKNSTCTLISLAIVVGFSAIASILIKADFGMIIMLFMFFVVNPIMVIGIGSFAERNISSAWYQPLLFVFLFALGSRIFFDMSVHELIFYSMVYLLLGFVSVYYQWKRS